MSDPVERLNELPYADRLAIIHAAMAGYRRALQSPHLTDEQRARIKARLERLNHLWDEPTS